MTTISARNHYSYCDERKNVVKTYFACFRWKGVNRLFLQPTFLPSFLVYNDFLTIIHTVTITKKLDGLSTYFYIIFQEAIGIKIEKKSQIQYSVMPYLIDCSVSEMCGDIISWKRESLSIYCSIHDVNVAKRVCTKQNHICIHVINYCACLLQKYQIVRYFLFKL